MYPRLNDNYKQLGPKKKLLTLLKANYALHFQGSPAGASLLYESHPWLSPFGPCRACSKMLPAF